MAGDKWQSKNTVSSDFDPSSLIVKSFFDCPLSGVKMIDCSDGSEENTYVP